MLCASDPYYIVSEELFRDLTYHTRQTPQRDPGTVLEGRALNRNPPLDCLIGSTRYWRVSHTWTRDPPGYEK